MIAALTLVDMVIFSSCRKRVAFADWIGQGADYSSTCAGSRHFYLDCALRNGSGSLEPINDLLRIG
jgi:hypothetical protein